MYRPTYISNADPTVTDDYANGFREGNFWWNSTDETLFVLSDHSTGSADWDTVTSSDIASWDDWTPTFTWTGNTPSSLSYVARYQRTGDLVSFTLDVTGTNDTGAAITNLTVSLPVTPVDNDNDVPVSTFSYLDSVCSYANVAYIDGTNNTANQRILRHASFVAIDGSDDFNLYFSGFYETS
jgi:hypothetical protein